MNSKVNVDSLIIENQALIYKVINDINYKCNTNDEFQTLYDYGLDGLINGAKTYDETKGKPSTYLYICIRNMINRHFYLSTRAKRKNIYGRDISLYDKTYIDNDSTIEIIDTLRDPNINIEKDLEKKLEIEKLMYAIDKLENKQDRLFLCDFYGLKGHKRLLAREIEEKYNVSHTTVSSRLKKARKTLKKYLEENEEEVFMLEKKK